MPKIDKGIPCPYAPTVKAKKSRWFQFLKDLVPGDSFLLTESELINVTHIARQIQVPHRVKHGPHESLNIPDGHARMWRMPEASAAPPPKADTKTQRAKPGPKPAGAINLL